MLDPLFNLDTHRERKFVQNYGEVRIVERRFYDLMGSDGSRKCVPVMESLAYKK